MLLSLARSFSVLPRMTSAPASSAAAWMPACTVCMKVSLWNTTPAISSLPSSSGAVVGSSGAAVGCSGAAVGCSGAAVGPHAVKSMLAARKRTKSQYALLRLISLPPLIESLVWAVAAHAPILLIYDCNLFAGFCPGLTSFPVLPTWRKPFILWCKATLHSYILHHISGRDPQTT